MSELAQSASRISAETDQSNWNRTYIQDSFSDYWSTSFIYDKNSKTLELINKLNLTINYKIKDSLINTIHPDISLVQTIKQKVSNPDDMNQFYPNTNNRNFKSSTEKIDYLLVTNERLKKSFTPLLQWKNRKGLNTATITMEEIDRLYEESTIQLKIKKCLLYYYKNHDLKWVLFGGDNKIIPEQSCYGKINYPTHEYEEYDIPTDLFYACFDARFDWNSFVDNKIGEPIWDAHDVTPAVRTEEQVSYALITTYIPLQL